MDIWDESTVLDVVSQLTLNPPFVERDQEYEYRRDLCFQRRFVSIPGVTTDAYGNPKTGMVQFRSPEIEDDAHSYKNRILASPLKIKVAAHKPSQKAELSAQRQEDFFFRHYYRWRDRQVFDGALFDQASIGLGVLRLSINTDIIPLIPDYEEGKEDKFYEDLDEEFKRFTSGEKEDLFVLESVDPNTLYWSQDDSVLLQKAEVPVNPLIEQYSRQGIPLIYEDGHIHRATSMTPGENVNYGRSNWNDTVMLYIVETSDVCYHVVDGEVLAAYRNYFKRPAYFFIVGEKTGSSHPLYKFRPLLNGKYQTVPPKNILRTAQLTSGAEAAQQRYSLEWIGDGQPPDDPDNVTILINDDGVLVASDPRYKVVNSGLQVGPDLGASLQSLEQADVYGYPKVLGRPDEVTATAGYDRALQQDAVASRLDPPLQHFASALTDVFKAQLSAVVEIGQPITVRSTHVKPASGEGVLLVQESTLHPDDMKEDTDISVSFSSVTIFSRIAMQEEGLKLMAADMMHESEFQTDVRGVDDLQKWRDQRALDKVLKNSDDLAVASVNQLIEKVKLAVETAALQKNGIEPPTPVEPEGEMVGTTGGVIRGDRGASIPSGPGQAMPVTPGIPRRGPIERETSGGPY